MTAKILHLGDSTDSVLQEACAMLADGWPVAIPTETVYGLSADATNPLAITRIYETKGRPHFNPLISHVADLAMAERYAVFDPVARRLAECFWPGPLTMILPLRPESGIHPLATAGLDTVGIRVPKGFSSSLIRAFDKPLAAPSANTSGRISPTSAGHVAADLGDKLKLIIDGGPTPVGVESTIVRVEGDGIRLLRPGGVSADQIEAATGLPIVRNGQPATIIQAPGMLVSHYAPSAAVRLNVLALEAGEALIRFGRLSVEGEDRANSVFNLSPSGDLAEAATNLFDTLKKADATGAQRIAVMPIPEHGLGEAINDRLTRAAAPRE